MLLLGTVCCANCCGPRRCSSGPSSRKHNINASSPALISSTVLLPDSAHALRADASSSVLMSSAWKGQLSPSFTGPASFLTAFLTGRLLGTYCSQDSSAIDASSSHFVLRASDQSSVKAPNFSRATCELGAQEPMISSAAVGDVVLVRMPAAVRVAGTKFEATVQMHDWQKLALVLGLPAGSMKQKQNGWEREKAQITWPVCCVGSCYGVDSYTGCTKSTLVAVDALIVHNQQPGIGARC